MSAVVTVRLNDAEEAAVRERLGVPSGSLGRAIKAAVLPELPAAPRNGKPIDIVAAGKAALEKQARGEALNPGEILAASKVPFAERPGYEQRESNVAALRAKMARGDAT